MPAVQTESLAERNAIYPAVLSGIDRALNWADFAGMRGFAYAD